MAETRRRASPEKTRPSFWWPLAAIAVPILSVMMKLDIRGADRLPGEGAFVLAPNHYSELDPLAVALSVWKVGRAPRFMAKESLFRVPVLGWVLRKTGMVPVARHSSASAARQTLTASDELAQLGRGVVVYPEGSLTRDPEMWPMRGKTGAVRLALEGGIPLIPMAQWGVQEIMPRYGKLRLWPLRRPVKLLIGEPMDLSAYRGRQGQQAVLSEVTDLLMAEIAALLAQLRDEPAPVTRWNPSAHGQNETGRLES